MKAAIVFSLILPAIVLGEPNNGPDPKRQFLEAAGMHSRLEYERAEAAFLEILEQVEDNERTGEYLARVHNGLGSVYQDLGKFDMAEREYRRAMSYYTRTRAGGPSFGVHVLANLASLFLETRQYGRLREAAKSAATLLDTIPQDTTGSARLNHLIGLTARIEGRNSEARMYLQRARKIFQALGRGFEVSVADTTNSLGTIAFSEEQYAEAIDFFRDAMQQYDLTKKVATTSRAATLANIACAYLHLRLPDDAQTAYGEALKALERGVGMTHPYAYQVILSYAQTLEDVGNKRAAREERRRAESLKNQEESYSAKHVIDVVELQAR